MAEKFRLLCVSALMLHTVRLLFMPNTEAFDAPDGLRELICPLLLLGF